MKNLAVLIMAVVLSATLSGCMLKSGDDLLSLPKPPSDYLMLQKNLDVITATGASLTSPNTGKNQAPIQLIDIDADGEPEAISLFKLSDESGQFRIYVHKKDGDSYRELGYIEGHCDAIESINYPRFNSSGERSILVSWQLGSSPELGMTVCLYKDDQLKTVLDTEYSNLVIDDLDQNGSDEIITIINEAKTGRFSTKLHEFRNDSIKMISETPLSKKAEEVDRIITGNLSDGARAVFVDSITEDNGLVTDVLMQKGEDLVNLALNDATGSGEKTTRKLSVHCADVDSDGVIEVPASELLPGYRESPDAQWSLLWSRFSSDGVFQSLFRTYHNFSEEWYLVFKDGWTGNITVTRSTNGLMRYTAFELYQKHKDPIPLLRIYAFTGDDRESLAKSYGFIYLGSSSSTAYSAIIPEEAAGQKLAPTTSELAELFHIIPEEWDSETY